MIDAARCIDRSMRRAVTLRPGNSTVGGYGGPVRGASRRRLNQPEMDRPVLVPGQVFALQCNPQKVRTQLSHLTYCDKIEVRGQRPRFGPVRPAHFGGDLGHNPLHELGNLVFQYKEPMLVHRADVACRLRISPRSETNEPVRGFNGQVPFLVLQHLQPG